MGQVAGKLPPRRGPRACRGGHSARHREKRLWCETLPGIAQKGTLESREAALPFLSRDRRSCPASPCQIAEALQAPRKAKMGTHSHQLVRPFEQPPRFVPWK